MKAFRSLALISVLAGVLALSTAPTAGRAAPLWLRTPQLWRIDDGLPQNVVKCEVQSSDGYIWVATQEGIGRFDGNRFTDFTTDNTPGLVSNNVHELVIDKTGAMWILAGGGLSRYFKGKFEKLIPVEPGMDSVQYVWNAPDGVVMVACERSLRRWVNGGLQTLAPLLGTSMRNTDFFSNPVENKSGAVWLDDRFGDLVIVDPSGNTRLIPATGSFSRVRDHVDCMDANGTVWVAGNNGIFKIVDDKPVLVVPISQFQNAQICQIEADRYGTLWVRTDSSSLFRLRGRTAEKIGPTQGIRGDIVHIDLDNVGNLWAQDLDYRRLYQWDGVRFEECAVPELVCWAWVSPVLRDRNGDIWVGTYGGLCCLRNTPSRTFNDQDGFDGDNVHSVCVDKAGRVWAGTDYGDLYYFDNGRFISPHFAALAHQSISCLAADADGALWVVGCGVLYKVDHNRATKMSAELAIGPNEYVQSIAVDRDNTLWIGTPNGIMAVRHSGGKYVVKRYTPRDSAPSEFIPVIAPGRDGEIRIGAIKSMSEFKNGRFKRYDMIDGLPAVPIISIYEDSTKTVWIGSWGEGLYRLKNEKITRIGVDKGLYADSVQGIVEDGHGSLVFASSKGVFTCTLDALNRCADGNAARVECTPLTLSDGDTGGVCSQGNQPVLAVDATGAIWAAEYHGALRYDPTAYNITASPTYIEQAVLNGKSYDPSRPAVVPPGTGDLHFRFTSLDFSRMNEARLNYRLDGFQSAWMPSGALREADYTNLPPGNYRFEVTEVDGRGNPIGRTASMAFRIRPHWYETIWFKVWAILGFIALGFALGFARMRALARQNTILEACVRRRTAELVDANADIARARDELSQQNEELQSLQSELEAQNDELNNAKITLETQNRDLETAHEQLARQNEELNNLATTDGLTGLPNRRAFQSRLDVEWKSATRYMVPLSLVMLDVDRFKQFNDTYGHQAGDAVLAAVGEALRQCARETDLPARYGGEEFAVILPHTDSTGAAAIAERIRETIESIDGLPRQVTASLGVVSLDASLDNPEQLILRADQALYQSKNNGRNRVTVATWSERSVDAAA